MKHHVVVYRAPINRFEAWRLRTWPRWAVRYWPIRRGPAVPLRWDPECPSGRVYFLAYGQRPK